MGLIASATNPGMNAIAGQITAVSLHTADPGTTGASEVTGGSPAYARKTPTFLPSAGGVVELDAPVEFDIPAGTVLTHVGLWAGGVFAGSQVIPGSVGDRTFTGQALLPINVLTLQADV